MIKKIIFSLLRAIYEKKIQVFKLQIKKFINYRKLKKKIIFEKKKINRNDLNEILTQIDNNQIHLKIDIEGNEYSLLDEILKNQKKLNGLIIEFHDCNLNKEKICNFIKNFEIPIVHIHGNNFAPVDIEENPTVIEISFSRFGEKFEGRIELPNKFDMPNDPNKKEILIKYKNSN